MTLINVGLIISAILFFLSFALLIFGSYVSYKDFSNTQSLTAPVKIITKYHLWASLGVGLSAFILLTVAIGFTWENLGFSIVLGIATLGFGTLDNFIRFKTITYLRKHGQNTSISSLLSELQSKINKDQKIE